VVLDAIERVVADVRVLLLEDADVERALLLLDTVDSVDVKDCGVDGGEGGEDEVDSVVDVLEDVDAVVSTDTAAPKLSPSKRIGKLSPIVAAEFPRVSESP